MWHHRIHSTPETDAMTSRGADGDWHTITWREAGERVRRIANALHAFGLAEEARCCILAETSVEWVLADMAIVCAGGATTTLYPSSPPEECAYIINDCDAVLVFCDSEAQVAKLEEIRAEIPGVTQVVVFDGSSSADGWVESLDKWEQKGERYGAKHPDRYEQVARAITPDRLATLMYTSGTTGRPKGVMLTHDTWVYEAEALDALGMINPADKQFLFLPLSHVFAKVMEVTFIRLGVPTVIDGNTNSLVANLAETRPTFMGAVPRIFEKAYNKIVSGAREGGPVRYNLFTWAVGVGREVSQLRQQGHEPSGMLKLRFQAADRLVFQRVKAMFGGRVRFFFSGGAPLSKEIAEFFHACDILILEGYGLTESGAGSTLNRVDDYKFGTVGPPIPGTEIKIAEDGEILIRGRGVMKGFYNQPEETETIVTADGWLMTGDIGMILDSGHVMITDRKKDLIVTAGGKNIAPANFQNLLKARCPYVSQVLMHGDRRNFCSALVTIHEDAVATWADSHDVSWTDYADLAGRPEVKALVQQAIDEVNRELPSYESVKKFALLPEELTLENGSLTPSLKVKRRVVEERYADLLDSFYEGTVTEL